MTTPPTPRRPEPRLPAITGLIDFFVHAPLNLCGPWLDINGPYTGSVTLTTFRVSSDLSGLHHVVGDSEGVIIDVNGALPPEWGRDAGWFSEDGQYDQSIYIPALGQFVVQHQFISGGFVTTQVVPINTLPTLVLWEQAAPARVGLATAPDVWFDLRYVRTGYPPPP